MNASEKPKALWRLLNSFEIACGGEEVEDVEFSRAAVEAWVMDALVRAWNAGSHKPPLREREAQVRAIIEGRQP